MVAAVRSALRQYAGFQGRARRSEFWWFTLAALLVTLVAVVIDLNVVPGSDGQQLTPVTSIVNLALLLPRVAVEVRRFHDIGRSGWYVLFGLIPLAGPIIVLVFLVRDGVPGPNQYGPDPKVPAVFA